ncbi:hypothetical protein BDW02DRAFT_652247 [Decorospora gaudefroyi]|uniref:Uncharacterized protein n=1 Tax=Decorospora gaudefroyi TaxID=184978 RepID=A0A6A5JW56_9PLEO|nr:hypothetical protein BDW02DRAFT_652247 [Decorospora gaudefroyi]
MEVAGSASCSVSLSVFIRWMRILGRVLSPRTSTESTSHIAMESPTDEEIERCRRIAAYREVTREKAKPHHALPYPLTPREQVNRRTAIKAEADRRIKIYSQACAHERSVALTGLVVQKLPLELRQLVYEKLFPRKNYEYGWRMIPAAPDGHWWLNSCANETF